MLLVLFTAFASPALSLALPCQRQPNGQFLQPAAVFCLSLLPQQCSVVHLQGLTSSVSMPVVIKVTAHPSKALETATHWS